MAMILHYQHKYTISTFDLEKPVVQYYIAK